MKLMRSEMQRTVMSSADAIGDVVLHTLGVRPFFSRRMVANTKEYLQREDTPAISKALMVSVVPAVLWMLEQLMPATMSVAADNAEHGETQDNIAATAPAILLDSAGSIAKLALVPAAPLAWPAINATEHAIVKVTRKVSERQKRHSS